jgi:ribosomal protein L29
MSLTNPFIDKEQFIPDNDPPLDKESTMAATNELSKKPPDLFKKSERRYVDPPIPDQQISLFSFMPSKDAKPDKHGIYGFAKIRGTYANEEQAQQRAIYIIQQVDSVNKIFHVKTGMPFPVSTRSDFSCKIDNVDLTANAKETISNLVRQAGDEDKKQIQEIRDRELQLKADVSKTSEQHKAELTPLDKYIFARKKLSDNLYVFVEHKKQLACIKTVICDAQKESEMIENEYPYVLDEYKEKYEQAARESGINESMDHMALMIKQYFNEKPDLDKIFNSDLL